MDYGTDANGHDWRSTGVALLSSPPQYPQVCARCGAMAIAQMRTNSPDKPGSWAVVHNYRHVLGRSFAAGDDTRWERPCVPVPRPEGTYARNARQILTRSMTPMTNEMPGVTFSSLVINAKPVELFGGSETTAILVDDKGRELARIINLAPPWATKPLTEEDWTSLLASSSPGEER